MSTLLLIHTSSTLAAKPPGHNSLRHLLQEPLLPLSDDLNRAVAMTAAHETTPVPNYNPSKPAPSTSSSQPIVVHNAAPASTGGAHGTSHATAAAAEVSAPNGSKTTTSDVVKHMEAAGGSGVGTASALISAADADAAHVDMVNGVPVRPTESDTTGGEMDPGTLQDQDGRATVASLAASAPSRSKFYLRWRCPPGYAKCGLLCWPCRAGYYSHGLSRWCFSCPVGTMSAAKSSKCTQCSTLGPGYTTQAAGRAECDKCLPGYAGKSCTACGYGKYSHGGLRSSRLVCNSCPNGYTTRTRTATSKVACVTSVGECHWQVSVLSLRDELLVANRGGEVWGSVISHEL